MAILIVTYMYYYHIMYSFMYVIKLRQSGPSEQAKAISSKRNRLAEFRRSSCLTFTYDNIALYTLLYHAVPESTHGRIINKDRFMPLFSMPNGAQREIEAGYHRLARSLQRVRAVADEPRYSKCAPVSKEGIVRYEDDFGSASS
jgi:hypothetical protein